MSGQSVEDDARPDLDTETIDFIITEMEDWGRALLAEHERRVCDVHGPVVPSKNTGQSLVQYAERLRGAIERDNVDKSLAGETPWDEAVRRAAKDPAACQYCGHSITVEDPTCCHVLGCRDCRPTPKRVCARLATRTTPPGAD